MTRDTAEEIILRRAEAKLSLTQAVIEGGHFSHGTVGTVADNASQLADILKFGLEKLMESTDRCVEFIIIIIIIIIILCYFNLSSLECEDLER